MTMLIALATGGFWTVGHSQYVRFPDLSSCELARPGVEQRMREYGYSGVRVTCRVAQ